VSISTFSFPSHAVSFHASSWLPSTLSANYEFASSNTPINPHWACVVGYGPFSLCVIHKEGLCPSSGDIRLLMNTTRSTFATNVCFVRALVAPLAGSERFFTYISIATIYAFEHVSNAANSYLVFRVPSMSLHRVILLERRLRLTRVLYGN
jgi:exo-beta-1,3-glucanase (GH17 family)